MLLFNTTGAKGARDDAILKAKYTSVSAGDPGSPRLLLYVNDFHPHSESA